MKLCFCKLLTQHGGLSCEWYYLWENCQMLVKFAENVNVN